MNLVTKLLSFGGSSIFGNQIEFDPSVALIFNEGEVFQCPKVFIDMESNACHWNVSKLFDQKLLDEIVIGYALSNTGSWFQHTWGMKDNFIVETSEINFLNIDVYFGVKVKNPLDFVELCRNNPKGNGKVRRIN